MKKKSLAALLSGLLTVSLTGVGFAGWLIVENASDSKTGSVSVEDVSVKTVTLSFAWYDNNDDGADTGDNVLSFGYKGASNQTGWFRNTDTTNESAPELKFSLTGSVSDGSDPSISAEVVVDEDHEGWVTATTTKKYIEKIDVVEEAGTGYTHVIRIFWGDAFDNVNPYDYYNGQAYSAPLAAEAKTKIEEMNELLDGVTFTLNISGSYVG